MSFTSIMEKARKKWKNLPRQVRVVIALMSFLKMDFEKLNKIRIEDIDMPNKKLFYWDFGDSQSKSVDMDPESQYYKQLTNTVQGEPLTTFLTKRFQRVGPTTAVKFAEFAKLKPEKRMGTLTNQELVNLSGLIHEEKTQDIEKMIAFGRKFGKKVLSGVSKMIEISNEIKD